MFKFHCSTILLSALLLVAPRTTTAQTNLITFDELPTQAVDGVSLIGGPGATPLIMPPMLEGNAAGLLTLNFATPINFLQFGSHLSIAGGVSKETLI